MKENPIELLRNYKDEQRLALKDMLGYAAVSATSIYLALNPNGTDPTICLALGVPIGVYGAVMSVGNLVKLNDAVSLGDALQKQIIDDLTRPPSSWQTD